MLSTDGISSYAILLYGNIEWFQYDIRTSSSGSTRFFRSGSGSGSGSGSYQSSNDFLRFVHLKYHYYIQALLNILHPHYVPTVRLLKLVW